MNRKLWNRLQLQATAAKQPYSSKEKQQQLAWQRAIIREDYIENEKTKVRKSDE